MKRTKNISLLALLMSAISVNADTTPVADESIPVSDKTPLNCELCQKNFNCPYGHPCPDDCLECYPEYEFWW